MSTPLVAIIHLGWSRGMGGGRRRVESWTQIFEAAGAETLVVPLLAGHRARFPDRLPQDMVDLVRGRVVPEVLSWSLPSVRRQLRARHPDLIVLNTARAYRPGMANLAPSVVLDFIDRLSVSYRQRVRIVDSPLRRIGYRTLTPAHRRFESGRTNPKGVVTVAAGWEDAMALGAGWIPITTESTPAVDSAAADHDVVFSGTLSYPPNIEALERLSGLWPSVLQKRPGTTALVAGASPPRRVVSLVREQGWTLMADFVELAEVLGRAHLAVAPLTHAAGIQIKVLDAAAHGMPQVVTPAAVAGFRPDFPVTVAEGDEAFVDNLVELLEDRGRCEREGLAARAHVLEKYTSSAWAPAASRLLERRHNGAGTC